MTLEEKRMAIAEACGLTVCRHGPEKWEHEGPEGDRDLVCTICRKDVRDLRLPDYLNDLNAMHEAEKVLTVPQSSAYSFALNDVLELPHAFRGSCRSEYLICHATAAQRAEAFIRVITSK